MPSRRGEILWCGRGAEGGGLGSDRVRGGKSRKEEGLGIEGFKGPLFASHPHIVDGALSP